MWSKDISLAYAGDGSRVAIGTNDPFQVILYENSNGNGIGIGNGTIHGNGNGNDSQEDGVVASAPQEWLPTSTAKVVIVTDTGTFDVNSIVTSLSLSHDGTILAIASSFSSSSSSSSSSITKGLGMGATRVYKIDDSSLSFSEWHLMGEAILSAGKDDDDIDDDVDVPNIVSLSSDGYTLAIGSKKNHNENGVDAGLVQVYRYTYDDDESESETESNINNVWKQLGQDLLGSSPGDNFGHAVALSKDGTTIGIGAPKYDADHSNENKQTDTNNRDIDIDAGMVSVFRYNAMLQKWIRLGENLIGTKAWTSFGNSIDISQDGNIVAVGMSESFRKDQYVSIFGFEPPLPSPSNNSTDNGNGTWKQLGNDLRSDGTDKNFFGHSISLSDDGSILAIGIPGGNDAQKTDSGLTCIYEYKVIKEPMNDVPVHTIQVNLGGPWSGAGDVGKSTRLATILAVVGICLISFL
eukprot:CAMPEP_0194074998 /NCGR_PEP_ID=MMETSP0149-20130528/2053_1 /TAXON_ID=122233 /ORGANISM="Chaetoceros debilis, Strain MM31A-1" /LENGTH=464 /DNA_ID=CAMNT_0038755333 /DNA_START=356 /DNA_END=1750 /DNA_ORIENTATION=-